MFNIKRYTEKVKSRWDDFVISHPDGHYSHLTDFKKILKETFNLDAFYLYIESKNKIKGIISFIRVNNRTLISIPFAEHGGILYDFDILSQIEALNIKIYNECEKYGYNKLQLHGYLPLSVTQKYNLQSIYYSGIIELEKYKTADEYLKDLSSTPRRQIRKSRRLGIKVYYSDSAEDIYTNFYPIYLRNMKRLGVPPFPVDFFVNCQKYLNRHLHVMFVKSNDVIMASVLFFTCGSKIYLSDFISIKNYWYLHPNIRLCYEMIKFGIENKYKIIDLGGMRYPGQIKFKSNLNVYKRDYYYYILKNSNFYNNTKGHISFQSFFYKFFTFAWRNFIPNFLVTKFGPLIRKNIFR